jgi:serine/threonine protein kinase
MSEPLDQIKPDDIIGPYWVVRPLIGRGGMARVFEVEVREKFRTSEIPRRLALKVAKPEYGSALKVETEYLRRFDHPNVVKIYPLPGRERQVYVGHQEFRFGWVWYYAMELISGGSLQNRMERTTRVTDVVRPSAPASRCLGVLEAIGIALQVLMALEHVHSHHVINLDVKPANILFRRRSWDFLRSSVPEAVLCDFGIARDMRTPRQAYTKDMGTPEYMSPEQVSEMGKHSMPVDYHSDIFSLGIVLYEMLAGCVPFENMGVIGDLQAQPLLPSKYNGRISGQLESTIMRALAKQPAYRFQSAAEMRVELEHIPLRPDWAALARRSLAGITLVGSVAGMAWLGGMVQTGNQPVTTPTPAVVPVITISDTPTWTVTPTSTPTVAPGRPTSTPKPTYTSTPTRRRPTGTPASSVSGATGS